MAHVLAKDLREAVLQAAVQGKLSKTLSSDTSVYQTTENFVFEKNELLLNKNMKDRNRFCSIEDDECLFDIPDTWTWIRINDIGIFKKGPFGSALTKSMFVKKDTNTIKVYEQKNAIQKNHLLGSYYITEEYYNSKMTGFKVGPGDIIVSCAGTIGEVYIIPENAEHGIINQALMRMNIVGSVNLDYFMLVFDHILKEEARNNSGGTAIKNIPPFDIFKAMPIPLPPIEEQARIVAKVDELMAKIDEYEKLENELVELKKNFPGDMKAAVLQAAMQGKLTEQLLDDTPISIPEINTHFDEHFDIPNSWRFVYLGDIFNIRSSSRVHKTDWRTKGVPFYRAREVVKLSENGFVKNELFIDEELYEKFAKSSGVPHLGDLLVSGVGTLGSTYIIKEKDKFYYKDASVLCFENINKQNAQFTKYLMNSPYMLQQIYDPSAFGTTVATLTIKRAKSFFVAVPPIEEQQRIVEKLDKLLPLCDALVE